MANTEPNLKLEFKTYVNEQKGVVVVKAPNAYGVFYNELKCMVDRAKSKDIGHTIAKGFVDYALWSWFAEKGPIMNNLTGKAKCNYKAGDTFNLEFGEELAKKRLLAKITSYRLDLYDLLEDMAAFWQEIFEARANNQYTHLTRLYVELDELEQSVH